MSRRPATDEERLAIAYKMRKAWAVKRGEDPSLVHPPTLEELKPPQRPDGRRRKKTRGEKLKQSISKREQMRAEKGLPPHPTEEEIAEKVRKFNEERGLGTVTPGTYYDPANATADPNAMTATTDLRVPANGTGTALIGPEDTGFYYADRPPKVRDYDTRTSQFIEPSLREKIGSMIADLKTMEDYIDQEEGMDRQPCYIQMLPSDWLTILTAIVGGE